MPTYGDITCQSVSSAYIAGVSQGKDWASMAVPAEGVSFT